MCAAVAGVTRHDDIVVVDTGGGRHRGRWLIGCDGGRGTVRKAAGIGFAGTEPVFTGYSVQATLADPTQLKSGRTLAPGGVYIFAPPDKIWTLLAARRVRSLKGLTRGLDQLL